MRKTLIGVLLSITALAALGYYVFLRGPELIYDVHRTLEEGISDPDYHTVLRIHRDCFDEQRRKNLIRFYQKYGGDDLYTAKAKSEGFLANYSKEQVSNFRKTQNIYIVSEKQEIIGLFNCREENEVTKGSIMIFNVCLKSSKRRKGLGARIMKTAIEKCSKTGKDLTLLVYKDDAYVVDFYKKLNFEIVSDLKEWDDQFPTFNKYLMKFRL